jgi:ribosomal protein S18 acetylase RimI-like enzyme
MFVRTASERDLPGIRALLVDTWHATYDAIYGAEKVAAITDEWHSIASLKALLARPYSEYLVADDGKTIGGVAFAVAADGGKAVMLRQLYVAPARQGAGIGTMLLTEIEGAFPDVDVIRVEVEPANVRAIGFYSARGYADAGRTANCGGGHSGIPAVIYEKRLA